MAVSGQTSPTSAVVDLEVEKVMQSKSTRPRKLKSTLGSLSSSVGCHGHERHNLIASSTASANVASSSSPSTSTELLQSRLSLLASRRSRSANHTNGQDLTSFDYAGRRSEDVCGVRRLQSALTLGARQLMTDGGSGGVRKSAFSPYKPTTVLTNLQRGNIETQTPCFISNLSLHQLAAQGELDVGEYGDAIWKLDEADPEGLTPLMWAASNGQAPTVTLLLSAGANPHALNKRRENAVLLAASNGHVDIVRSLLKRGVDVDHMDEHGNTALMYAAFNNHACCAQELLRHKADVTMENHFNDTAYCIAITRGSKQVQIIIERHLLKLLEKI